MKPAVHAIAALLLCSCASNRHFAPRIATGGWSASGMPVAIYGFGEGSGRAELRIWSDGADLYEDGEGKRTRLHVGLELINLGEGTLALEPAFVHVQDLQGDQDGKPVLVPESEPVQVQGSGMAAKGRTARLALWFEPPGLRPRQIDGFDVRWKVQLDADRVVEQVTPFGPWTMPEYYPYYPYGSYWGWGWGWGWGFAPHHICH
jgi:hypothetical protein